MMKFSRSSKSGCNPISSGCTSVVLIVIGIAMMIISSTISKDTARSVEELAKADSITSSASGIVKGTGELWAEKPVHVPYGSMCAAYNLKGQIFYTEHDGSSSEDSSSTPYDKPTLGETLSLKTEKGSIPIKSNTQVKIFGSTSDQGDLDRVDEIPPMYPFEFTSAMLGARDGLDNTEVFRFFKIDVTAIENGSQVFVLGFQDQNQLSARESNRPLVIALSEKDYKSYLDGQEFGAKLFFWIGLFILLIGIGWLFMLLLLTVGIAAGGVWLIQKLLNKGQQN